MACEHENIGVSAHIVTLGGARSLLAQVFCSDCGRAFLFRGAPGGASPNHPRISTDRSTISAPIEPADIGAIDGE